MFGLTNKCLPGAPMWTIDRSVRYHSNDGGVFNGGLGIRTYHPYGEGDVIDIHPTTILFESECTKRLK